MTHKNINIYFSLLGDILSGGFYPGVFCPRPDICVQKKAIKVSFNRNGLLFKKITFKILNGCDRFQ